MRCNVKLSVYQQIYPQIRYINQRHKLQDPDHNYYSVAFWKYIPLFKLYHNYTTIIYNYICVYIYIYIYIYIYYITRILLLFHERDPSTALSFSNKSILSHISNFLDCKFSDHKITSVSPAEANTSEEDVLLSLIIQQNVRMSLFRIPAHKFTIQLVKG